MRKIKDIAQAIKWIAESEKGDSVIYYTGVLSRDRIFGHLVRTKVIDTIAKIFWSNSELCTVRLVQKKVANMAYEYIAIKR